jgi:hypothetical protein
MSKIDGYLDRKVNYNIITLKLYTFKSLCSDLSLILECYSQGILDATVSSLRGEHVSAQGIMEDSGKTNIINFNYTKAAHVEFI